MHATIVHPVAEFTFKPPVEGTREKRSTVCLHGGNWTRVQTVQDPDPTDLYRLKPCFAELGAGLLPSGFEQPS